MAEEAEAQESEESGKSGGMMKTLMMGMGIFIIVLVGQTIAPLISSKLGLLPPVVVQQDPATAEAGEEGAASAPPIYWPLKPAMVVNFAGSGESGFLQVEMEVMSREQAVIDQIKEHTPAIRNSLLLLLASQNDETIFSTDGKNRLLAESLAEINTVIAPYLEEEQQVEAVYFTSFVAQ